MILHRARFVEETSNRLRPVFGFASEGDRRMLLDDYLPEFDVRTSYATRIAASPAKVYASLWTANFDHWGVTRALYAVRTLPSFPGRPRETWRRFRDELFRHRFTLDGMLSEGF